MGAVGILSDQSFQSLNEAVCEPTLKAIADMGFTHMTEIQVIEHEINFNGKMIQKHKPAFQRALVYSTLNI